MENTIANIRILDVVRFIHGYRYFIFVFLIINMLCLIIILSGMSLEAGNRQKSPVTLAVTAGYFFSLKKIMRENLSSISNTTYSACIY
jgi:hypothetical protein